MTELEWNGHKIQLACQLAARYLWTATETRVIVDGIEIARAGGFRLNETIAGKFAGNSLPHQLALSIKVDVLTFASAPYKLFIDEVLVAQGRLRIRNRFWSIVPIVVLPLFLCVLLMLVTSHM